jgi:hypothetical protein
MQPPTASAPPLFEKDASYAESTGYGQPQRALGQQQQSQYHKPDISASDDDRVSLQLHADDGELLETGLGFSSQSVTKGFIRCRTAQMRLTIVFLIIALQKSIRHSFGTDSFYVLHVCFVHACPAVAVLEHSEHVDDVAHVCAQFGNIVCNVPSEEGVSLQYDLFVWVPLTYSFLAHSGPSSSLAALFTMFQTYTISLVCAIYAAQGNADTGSIDHL